MFIGNKLVRWDDKEPEDRRKQLLAASETYYDSAKSSAIRTDRRTEDIPWNNWEGEIAFAPVDNFPSILAFFVNVPKVHMLVRAEDESIRDWYWEEFSDVSLHGLFSEANIRNLVLHHTKNSQKIESGWVLQKIYGRVDEDTTYSDFTYLLKSRGMYVFVRSYQETLH